MEADMGEENWERFTWTDIRKASRKPSMPPRRTYKLLVDLLQVKASKQT